MQNLVYEWVDFSKFGQIWAKIGWNLRKFWKKLVILFKIWPKIGPIGIWMVTFSWKTGICMGLLSNSVAAHPYQNQTWVPPPGFDGHPESRNCNLLYFLNSDTVCDSKPSSPVKLFDSRGWEGVPDPHWKGLVKPSKVFERDKEWTIPERLCCLIDP